MLRLTKYGRENTMKKYADVIMALEEEYELVVKREEVELAEENVKGLSRLQFYEKKLALQDEKKELMTQVED